MPRVGELSCPPRMIRMVDWSILRSEPGPILRIVGNNCGEPSSGVNHVRLEASGLQQGIFARRQCGLADFLLLMVLSRPLGTPSTFIDDLTIDGQGRKGEVF